MTRPSLEDICPSPARHPAAASRPRPGRAGGAALTLSQVRNVNKAYWRSPAAAFFALMYPLMFLVIFTSIFRNSNVPFGAERVSDATYYVPGMVAVAVITVCFNNIAVAVTFKRDSGCSSGSTARHCPACVLRRPETACSTRVGLAGSDHRRVRARVLQR